MQSSHTATSGGSEVRGAPLTLSTMRKSLSPAASDRRRLDEIDAGEWWGLGDEPALEVSEHGALTLDLDEDALRVVAHVPAEIELAGEAVHEGAEPDPLHDTAHPQPAADTVQRRLRDRVVDGHVDVNSAARA